jgi:hypothetical protein
VTPLLSDVEGVRQRVTVISGDIRMPNLGVRDFAVFVGIDEVIHAASLLNPTSSKNRHFEAKG